MSENKTRRKRMSVDEYKQEMEGKTYNWLTVLDVYKDVKSGRATCKCQCKCGNTVNILAKNIISSKTKSCGCYNHSKEKSKLYTIWFKSNPDAVAEMKQNHSQWFKDNPDKVAERSEKYRQWCNNHQDKLYENGKTISEWYRNNPELVAIKSKKNSDLFKNNDFVKARSDKYIQTRNKNRVHVNYECLLQIIHPNHVDDLLSGKITSTSLIKTKCPVCNNYDEHLLNNVFTLKTGELKNYNPPLCSNCVHKKITSSYEEEISNYISTFYNGLLLRNSRDIYYPEKRIAIEFNGDYFHDEDHKNKDYHLNKYKSCKEKVFC